MKHTPAPWYYQEGSDAYTHIVRTGEISRDNPHVGRRFLCQLAQTTTGESEANARLIAAAPEMLAVLNAARIMLKNRDQRPEEMKLLDAIRAVVAKAEGHALSTSNQTREGE